MAAGRLSVTLAILKPDVVKVPYVLREIRHKILDSGFFIVRSKEFLLNKDLANKFYEEHQGRFFLNRLVTFMSSGPIHVHVLAHEDAVLQWRQIMGPTKVYKAQYEAPATLRGSFGLSDTRNCSHGSDSLMSSAKEISFFFPDFSINDWYQKEEPLFRAGKTEFYEDDFVHIVSQ
nr:EOG090X0HUX [Eulimnadia texana]